MRALAGLIAFNGLALALGMGVLGAAGLLRLRLRSLIVAAPAGLVVGAALFGLAGIAVLTAGGTLALPPFVAGAVLAAAALWAVTLRRRAAGREPEEVDPDSARLDRYATWALAIGIAVFALVQAYSSRNVPAAWDAAHNWMLKAFALSSGGLEGDMFTDRVPFGSAHLDYPILQPVLGGLVFRFAAKGEHGLLLFELWVLAGALALSGPFLAGRRHRAWLTMLPLGIAIAGGTSAGLLRGDADVTLGIFLAAGTLALALWLDDGPPGLAVVAAILLGAALNTKNEGTAFTAAIVVVAGVVLAVTARRRLLPFAGIVVALAVLAAPWRLWVRANGPFAGDVTPLSTSLDVGFLADRLDRLNAAGHTVLGRFTEQTGHGWLMPAFLAVTIALVIAGPRRRVPAFYLGGVLLSVAALLWVYWTTSQPDWLGHYTRTSIRTVTGPLFVAAAALGHLLPRSVELPAPPPDSAPATGSRPAATVPPAAASRPPR